MTTFSTTVPTAGDALRRIRALAGAETRLLLRNRTAFINSVLAPLVLVAAVPAIGGQE